MDWLRIVFFAFMEFVVICLAVIFFMGIVAQAALKARM
jgi:hypothetical protein